jgi:MFS transporter, UMF1 family
MITNDGKNKISKRSVLSWALYDLANQFFALIIVSLYFPRWVTIEKGVPEIFYSLAFGGSMILVAAAAPILGVIADARRNHKAFLVFFTLLSITFTISLSFPISVFLALVFFAIANFGCQGAIVFYNALMVNVAPRDKIGLVSGFGRMFGYLGAILAIYLTKPVILNAGYRPTFLITGVLFLVFSLPCMIFVRRSKSERSCEPAISDKINFSQAYRRLKEAFINISKLEGFRKLLKASFFGLCAVNTIMLFMFVYAGKVFGLGEAQLINLIAFSTVFAIIGSILSGFMSDIVGYRRCLIGVFILWVVCILGASLLSVSFLWAVGALVGFSVGGTWVILRAMVIKIVPEETVGEAFGLFSLVCYLSAVVGPVFWGVMLLCLSRLGEWGYRLSFLSLIMFVMIAIWFLLNMKKEGEQQCGT